MTPGTWPEIEAMEQAVADARAAYIKRVDKKQGSTAALWAEYMRLLHVLRLRKREMKGHA